MSDQLENIIRYIEDEMLPEERAAFEILMEKKETLKKEVIFQRGLHGFLSRNQPELESKLDALGDEFIINQSNQKNKYWLIGILLFIVVSIGAYLLFFPKKNTTTTELENTPIETESVITPPQEETTIKPLIEEKIEEKSTVVPELPIKAPNKPSITDNQPIAALEEVDYSQNSILEGVIEDAYRGNSNEDIMMMMIEVPKMDTILNTKNGMPFIIKGYTNIESPYDVIIYSNRTFDIENDYRTFTHQLKGIEDGELYLFDYKANLSLEKGLYYLIIRKGNSRKVLHISRFKIQ